MIRDNGIQTSRSLNSVNLIEQENKFIAKTVKNLVQTYKNNPKNLNVGTHSLRQINVHNLLSRSMNLNLLVTA